MNEMNDLQNLEELEENKLIIKDSTGTAYLSTTVVSILNNYYEAKEKFEKYENELRQALKNVMFDNNIMNAKIGEYSISQVIPKPIIEFDTNAFIDNENEDIVNAFTKIETEYVFDLEEFKKDNPMLFTHYYKQVVKDVQVDTEKLKAVFPAIYEKYETIKESKKQKTITIRKNGK